jgi:hypothetical protein
MPGVIFYHEPNHVDVFSGMRETLNAWNYAIAMAGDIDKAIIVNRTGHPITFNAAIDYTVVEEPPDIPANSVWLTTPWENHDAIPLWDFSHSCEWYMFGPASGWNGSHGDDCVTIPQSGTGALHAVHIASIVMAHRYGTLKWQFH